MNEKEVLIRIIDAKHDYPIRTEWTSIPSEVLKMYHYMVEKEDLYLTFPKPLDEGYANSKYDEFDASVTHVEVNPGGYGNAFCINVYVKVYN